MIEAVPKEREPCLSIYPIQNANSKETITRIIVHYHDYPLAIFYPKGKGFQ